MRLLRYPAGYRQEPHSHADPHLSLILAGGFSECVGRGEASLSAGQVGARPDGLRHAVRFGPGGALVLTFSPPRVGAHAAAVSDPRWSARLSVERLRRLVPLLLEGGADADDAAFDLLALASAPARSPRVEPWLAQAMERLEAAPADTRLTDLAEAAGRHRVHFGRSFLAAYGEAPSVRRRRLMVDRALCRIAAGEPSASAAVAEGFADQSHLIRACRAVFGAPPARLMRRVAALHPSNTARAVPSRMASSWRNA